jgi:rhamnulokinase
VHYRDSRHEGMPEIAFASVPRGEIYAATGIQIMSINTLFQLLSEARSDDPLLSQADRLLMMPDLFSHFLSGSVVAEYTDATTSGCLDPHTHDWARPLLERLGIPTHFLPEVVPPGTVLGPLLPEVAEATGLAGTKVVATASHDTASAVAGTPLAGTPLAGTPQAGTPLAGTPLAGTPLAGTPLAGTPLAGTTTAYISSGTWSLVGLEVAEPVLDGHALAANVTNEGGYGGTITLLKNVVGLWIVQQCRGALWEEHERPTYEELSVLAAGAPPATAFIDPNDGRLLWPGDMPARVRQMCAETGQPVPADTPTLLRVILESLALSYAAVLDELTAVTAAPIEGIHVVGGGSSNTLLCQLTADVSGRPVTAGPVEATAIGNIAIQAISAGELSGITEARELVARSFPTVTYEPSGDWSEARARFAALRAAFAKGAGR